MSATCHPRAPDDLVQFFADYEPLAFAEHETLPLEAERDYVADEEAAA